MPDRDSVYAELFNTYHQSLINYCISKGVRPTDSEDIVSEAFARALAKAEEFLALEPNQQKSWLYSAVSYIMKENNRKVSPVAFSEIENIENYIKENDELEQLQSEEDYQQYVKLIYDELESDKERELFKLIFDKKIDYKALSREYDVSPGAARLMVHRFRNKLNDIVNKLLTY